MDPVIDHTNQTDKIYDVSRNAGGLASHIDTINDIFTFLEKQNADWSNEKVFIDGEHDSNQTRFEHDSNHGEIGVLCNNDDVGHCLLFFLRIFIDRNFFWFFSAFHIVDDSDSDETVSDADGSEEEEANPTPGVITPYDNAEIERTNFNLTMIEIFNILKRQERRFTKIYDKDKEIKIELMDWAGGCTLTRAASDIDLWNLPRIRDALIKWLESKVK